MIDFELDFRSLRAYRAEFGPLWERALSRAMKAELFRLMGVMKRTLSAGVGAPRAPLTRAESSRKTAKALSYLARVIAYEVRKSGSDFEGIAGPSAQASRRKRAVPLGLLSVAVGPRSIRVTRATQAAIAAKLRRKGSTRILESGRRRKAKLPAVGATLTIPARHYAAAIETSEGRKSAEHVARLVAMGLRGERWASKWWEE